MLAGGPVLGQMLQFKGFNQMLQSDVAMGRCFHDQVLRWQSLQDSLRTVLRSPQQQQIAQSIFATSEPTCIAAVLAAFCCSELGGKIAACGFSYLRVGATFILQLTTGSIRVVKAYGADQSWAALQASLTSQARLARCGFPCPDVIAGPQRVGPTLLAAQAYVPAGTVLSSGRDSAEHGQVPRIRRAMAITLARLIQTTQCDPPPPDIRPWLLAGPDQLWPKPHNVLIDFQQTAAGADWIDAIARQAKQQLQDAPGEIVLGHSDWSLQNMAFQGDELVCVYDWDALRLGQEAWFVGGAARCFNQDWRDGLPPQLITVAEAQAFIQDYERARGRSFSATDQRMIGAALVYTAAYGTRCAHQGSQPETAYARKTKAQLRAFANHFLP